MVAARKAHGIAVSVRCDGSVLATDNLELPTAHAFSLLPKQHLEPIPISHRGSQPMSS